MKAKSFRGFLLLLAGVLVICACSCGRGGESAADVSESTKTDASGTDASEAKNDSSGEGESAVLREYKPLNYKNMKAMWLSQYDLNGVYCSGGNQREESSFRKLIENNLDYVKESGINTVIVQVRPNGDSMYPSEVFPASAYVVGSYGKTHGYDPFEIIVEEAHKRELSVQAWINPMRCMSAEQIKSVPADYKLRSWYDNPDKNGKLIVLSGNYYYLNPAYPEVRELIIDGAKEILRKYDVDGLHMDDYFYPTTDEAFDSPAYTAYKAGGGNFSLADFRRGNLNQLVAGLYAAVKARGDDFRFGVSPAGNINTVFNSQYADVYTWCSVPGYLDYICPQVYFGLEHQNYDFIKVAKTFQDIIKIDSVRLIIGMTLSKAKAKTDTYAGTGKNEWAEHDDILKRCLEYTVELPKCEGVSYFCLQYFRNPVTGVSEPSTKAERDNFLPVLEKTEWVK